MRSARRRKQIAFPSCQALVEEPREPRTVAAGGRGYTVTSLHLEDPGAR